MISVQAIEAKLKRFDDSLCQGKRDLIIARKELLIELEFSEDEAQQKTLKDLEEAEKAFTETKQNRYILYEIYYTLRVKYPCNRDVADLAKELLDSVTMGKMGRQELEELRTAIGNMLGQQDIPSSAKIKELFEPLLWRYADRETKERMLQELRQQTEAERQQKEAAEQRAEEERKQAKEERKQAKEERKQAEEERKQAEAAEQRAEEERKQAEEHKRQRVAAEQQAEEERKQREKIEQDILLLKRQLLELEQQLQAQTSQKIAVQTEELSPIGSSSSGSAQNSPQHHDPIQSSPVITTSFDMGTTSTKQPLLEGELAKEQEQCAPSAKKQCLRPSQDS